jgi:peptide/nickel transport system ATP-binding protein
VVAVSSKKKAAMYAGRIVDEGTVDEVLDTPAHPYTRGLIDSVPARHAKGTRLSQIEGRMPPLTELPAGCAFGPRCPRKTAACDTRPEVSAFAGGRRVRCFHPLEGAT